MIPPIMRRLFTSSPILAPLLAVLALLSIIFTIQSVPRLLPGVGNPVGANALAAADKAQTTDCAEGDANGLCPIEAPPPIKQPPAVKAKPVKNKSPQDASKNPSNDPQRVAAPPPDFDTLDAPLPSGYDAYFPGGRLPESLKDSKYGTLASQLGNFLRRPVLDHAVAEDANRAGCPLTLSDKLVNPDQLKGNHDFWLEVDGKEIVKRRAELVNYLAGRAQKKDEIVGEGQSKQGIVMTAGNKDTTERLIAVLRHMRKIGSKLPVEVFHFEDEMKDAKQVETLKELDAKPVQVSGISKIAGSWKNFHIKALAMIQSSFTELVYLDSDNTPLHPVETLFTDPLYENNGRAAFWPDINKEHADNAVWRVMGETCNLMEWEFESGEIVIDKNGNNGLNLAALWLAAGMMEKHEFWFKLSRGDKDTFRWAFRALDIPYATAPRWLSAMGMMNNGRFCGHTMLQYGLTSSRPMFAHSNLLKHLGGQTTKGSLFTHVKKMQQEAADEPTLNYAHMAVYNDNVRGMCLDLEMDTGSIKGDQHEQDVVTLKASELDNVFETFEESWWNEGGRSGGW